MREYETTLIVQPEISDEGIASLQERLNGILEGADAIPLLYDDLGKRRLAYEIQDFQKGRYVMLQFLDKGSAIPGFERALRLEDSVIRFLTVQVSDRIEDVPARQAVAVEERRIRAEKAAERAAREAEETRRREEAAAEAELRSAAEREAREAKEAKEASEAKEENEEKAETEPPDSDDAATGDATKGDSGEPGSGDSPDSTTKDETDKEAAS
jgi:small subunit ribosomal protein S6